MLAPIILFVYQRPDHTQKTIEALQKNTLAPSSELYIYSDAAKSRKEEPGVAKTRAYIKTVKGFKKINIIEREHHCGLANSLIPGITEVITEKGKAIILEDDLVSSPNMLQFMNDCLNFYEKNRNIFAISAYNFPINIPTDYREDVYLSYRALSWGWATWRDRWEKADWEIKDFNNFSKDKEAQKLFNRGGHDLTRMLTRQMNGEIDSWAIRWCYTLFKQSAYSIIPVNSKIINIGADSSGTHVGKTKKYNVVLDDMTKPYHLPEKLQIHPGIMYNLQKIFKKKSFIRRLIAAIYHHF